MMQLFPLNRSLTGKDNLKTLYILKKFLKKIRVIKFKSGTKIFDWVILRNGMLKMLLLQILKIRKYVTLKKTIYT